MSARLFRGEMQSCHHIVPQPWLPTAEIVWKLPSRKLLLREANLKKLLPANCEAWLSADPGSMIARNWLHFLLFTLKTLVIFSFFLFGCASVGLNWGGGKILNWKWTWLFEIVDGMVGHQFYFAATIKRFWFVYWNATARFFFVFLSNLAGNKFLMSLTRAATTRIDPPFSKFIKKKKPLLPR